MSSHEEDKLDPNDELALDFLVEAGFDSASIDRMPEHLRQSARRLLHGLGELDRYPVVPPSESLVDATLARIDQEERHRRERMSFTASKSPRLRFRMPNLVAVAAVAIVAVGVAFPVAHQVRWSSSQSLCANGLRNLGAGISSYSADNHGMMPMTAGIGGIFTGDSKGDEGILDNAQHLELLSKKGYCAAGCTKCNGARTLSYRVPLHKAHYSLVSMARSPIAGDANPIQMILQQGRVPNSNMLGSINHGQRGQNILYSDGTVVWTASPILPVGTGGAIDNIWVIQQKNGAESLNIKGRAGRAQDIFLSN